MKNTFRFAVLGFVAAIALGMGIIGAQDGPPANAVNLVGPLHPVYENPDGTVLQARYVGSPISPETGTTIAEDVVRIQNQQNFFGTRINTLGDEDLSFGNTLTAHSARITQNATDITAIQADDWVTGRRIAANTIGSGNLVENIISENRLLGNNVVQQRNIGADQIIQGHLQDNVVGTDELINGSITTAKLSQTVANAIANTGSGEIDDNSIAPTKALADTDAEKRAWRIRLDAAHISIGTTLPDLADTGGDDVRIIPQDVPSGLSFVDIADRGTVLTSASAGDVMMVITFREKTWVRVGNIITGRGDQTARDAAEANTAARWPGVASVTPTQITHNTGVFTMRVTLDRVTGTFPNGAHMRIHERLRHGELVPAVENDFNTPATLDFTINQTADFIRQSRNHVARAELRIYDDNQASNLLATLPIDVSVAQPEMLLGWRVLPGGGPYTVRPTDSEFKVWVEHTSDSVEYGITISRNRLGTTAKKFAAAQNNLQVHDWYGVAANLNAAGTQLTIAESGQNQDQWSILAVEAR